MSGVKHTRGPWVWKQSDRGEHESLVVSGTLNDFVLWPETELGSYGLSSREWCEVSEANARLIAAAPCMFEYILSSAQNGCATAQEIVERATGDRPEKGGAL